MSDRNLNDLDPALLPLAQRFEAQCNASPLFTGNDYKVIIDQTYRSEADQNADYAKGRDAAGNIIDRHAIITNARYGQSPHNCTSASGAPAARAFDFAIVSHAGFLDWNAADPYWQEAIKIGESMGLESGSAFHSLKDSPHMELKNWKETIPS